MKIYLIFITMATYLVSLNIFAEQKFELSKAINQLRLNQPKEMEFNKTFKSDFSKPKVSSGKLIVEGKKLFIESLNPDKTQIIIDGNYLWNIQFPPEDFDGSAQYARQSLKKIKDTDPMLQLFYKPDNLLTNQKSAQVIEQGMTYQVSFSNLKNELYKNLVITFDIKSYELIQIKFEDEIKNQTIIEFKNIKNKIKISKNQFTVKVPSKVQVINL